MTASHYECGSAGVSSQMFDLSLVCNPEAVLMSGRTGGGETRGSIANNVMMVQHVKYTYPSPSQYNIIVATQIQKALLSSHYSVCIYMLYCT